MNQNTKNGMFGIGAIAVLVVAFMLGRGGLPLPTGAQPVKAESAQTAAPAYQDQVKPMWDEIIALNESVESKISNAARSTTPNQSLLTPIAQLTKAKREDLRVLQGKVEVLPCPEEFTGRREALKSGIKANLDYLERLQVIATLQGSTSDLADMAGNGESASRYYRDAKLSDSWSNFPETALNVQGKLERLVAKAKTKQKLASNATEGDPGSSDSGVIVVKDPLEQTYVTELKQLVRNYDASRKQFNVELNSGLSTNYAASSAFTQRTDILNRLGQMEPVPTRYMHVHATFKSVVQQGMDAVRDFYQTGNRYGLQRSSITIKSRLESVKRALGIR